MILRKQGWLDPSLAHGRARSPGPPPVGGISYHLQLPLFSFLFPLLSCGWVCKPMHLPVSHSISCNRLSLSCGFGYYFSRLFPPFMLFGFPCFLLLTVLLSSLSLSISLYLLTYVSVYLSLSLSFSHSL